MTESAHTLYSCSKPCLVWRAEVRGTLLRLDRRSLSWQSRTRSLPAQRQSFLVGGWWPWPWFHVCDLPLAGLCCLLLWASRVAAAFSVTWMLSQCQNNAASRPCPSFPAGKLENSVVFDLGLREVNTASHTQSRNPLMGMSSLLCKHCWCLPAPCKLLISYTVLGIGPLHRHAELLNAKSLSRSCPREHWDWFCRRNEWISLGSSSRPPLGSERKELCSSFTFCWHTTLHASHPTCGTF